MPGSTANPQRVIKLAWDLSTLTYQILRPAKLHFHYSELNRRWKAANADERVQPYTDNHDRNRWLLICSIIYHSLQLCRLLPPDFDKQERELRIRLLTTYGLALGCLNRSSEANRRFNEAHALALIRPTEDLPLQLARIHLRRAEMSIYCFHSQMPMSPEGFDYSKQDFSYFAHLDDAWATIERGEAALSGLNQSSFWWYRVAVTKLSCLAALARASKYPGVVPGASFPLRRRQHLPTVIEELLGEALYSAEGDHFRELRAADYALRASFIPVDGSMELEGAQGKTGHTSGSSGKSFLQIRVGRDWSKDGSEDGQRRFLYQHLKEILAPGRQIEAHLESYLVELRSAYFR
jgi:hypothetical protein